MVPNNGRQSICLFTIARPAATMKRLFSPLKVKITVRSGQVKKSKHTNLVPWERLPVIYEHH